MTQGSVVPAVSLEDEKQTVFPTACPPGAGRGLQPLCPQPLPAAPAAIESGVRLCGAGKVWGMWVQGLRSGGVAGLQGAVVLATLFCTSLPCPLSAAAPPEGG